jgi:hypothetical protein
MICENIVFSSRSDGPAKRGQGVRHDAGGGVFHAADMRQDRDDGNLGRAY